MYSLKFNFMKLEYIFKLHKTDICVYLSASVGSEGISLREMVGSRTSWSIFLYLRLGIDLQACNFRMNTFVTLRRRRSIECPWVDFVHTGTWKTLLTDSFPAPGLGVITNQNRFHNCWGKGLFGRYPNIHPFWNMIKLARIWHFYKYQGSTAWRTFSDPELTQNNFLLKPMLRCLRQKCRILTFC